jgi:hypothetical protein
MKRLHARVMIAPCAIGFVFAAAMAIETRAAEIVVSWTEVQEQVRPRPGMYSSTKSVRLTLQGGSAIAETYAVTNRRGKTNTHSSAGRLRGALGVTRNITSSWRVESSKSLVRTANRLQHTETIRVTLDSDHSCRATISYRLKPGFSEYQMRSVARGDALFIRSISVPQISCRVTPQ